jgi:hypothetical protein
MPFRILGAIASTGEALFEGRQDDGASGLGSREMRVDVVDVHQDAIDDPWRPRPLASALAVLSGGKAIQSEVRDSGLKLT